MPQVPLIIRVPGQSERVDIEEVVSLVDIAPTLLDWLWSTVPPSFEGRSLKPILLDERPGWLRPLRRVWYRRDPTGHPAFSELITHPRMKERRHTPHERAIVLGSHKLIAGVDGEREFYDLANDPGEREPNGPGADERKVLLQTLDGFSQHAAQKAAPRKTVALDEEIKERMRALGYTE